MKQKNSLKIKEKTKSVADKPEKNNSRIQHYLSLIAQQLRLAQLSNYK